MTPLTGENALIVEGKQVDYTFLPGEPLVVSHAEYRLGNRSPNPATCSIASCQFIENGAEETLPVFHVYAGDRSLDRVVVIPPAADLDIRVTFPFREAHVGVRFTYAVRLTLECEDRWYAATSRLNIVQEKP